MRILFFSHYFPPEGNAPANRTFEHCARWVAAGHQVTVVTSVPNVPKGVPYPGFRNRWKRQRETLDGIEVIRVWTYLAANAGFGKRILNYLSYMLSSVWVGLTEKRPEIVIATSPQFFCGWAGVLTKWLLRVPFILEVRDIWPESIEAVGAIRKGKVIRVLEFLERRMYLSADCIVTVGKGYRENVAGKTFGRKRIEVIYNGIDGNAFEPREPDLAWLDRFGMAHRFVCAYVGTIGMAHGLETVLDAAEILRARGRTDIGFLLVGDGARKEELELACQERGLSDWVRFTGLLEKKEMPKVLASSHALLVHLRPCELFQTVIPSKIFEAMAMCRPIIMGVQGESAEIVAQAQSGIEMAPGNPHSLADAVCRLCDDQTLYRSLQEKGRSFVLSDFSRDTFAARYLDLIQETLDVRRGSTAPRCATTSC